MKRMDKGSNTKSNTWGSWVSRAVEAVPASLGSMSSQRSQTAGSGEGITFADMAPYLVVTEESLHDVSARLGEGVEMDVTKFRPNIVLSGSGEPWEEDFWGGLTIIAKDVNGEVSDDDADKNEDVQCNHRIMELVLTSNCARCRSINVDYETGKQGTGETGSVLRKLMGDRRVDKGMKYNPIFGRYAFLVPPPTSTWTTYGQPRLERAARRRSKISVGDEVFVSKRNESRTIIGKTRLLSSQDLLSSIDNGALQSGRAWLVSPKGNLFLFLSPSQTIPYFGELTSYRCGCGETKRVWGRVATESLTFSQQGHRKMVDYAALGVTMLNCGGYIYKKSPFLFRYIHT